MSASGRAHLVVFGNTKGGTGKSTTAMHVAVRLLHNGWRVGVIDLDGAQSTTTRYAENRLRFCDHHKLQLPQPQVRTLLPSNAAMRDAAQAEERQGLDKALAEMVPNCDAVIIDCPGHDHFISRVGHG